MKTAIANGSFLHEQVVDFTIPIQQLSNLFDDCLEQEEIELEGKMYDVVSARKKGSYIVVQAICDNDETTLIKAYQQVMSGKRQSLPDKQLACLKNFFSPFIISTHQPVFYQLEQYGKSRLPHETTPSVVNLYGTVLKPPPRFA